VRQQELPTPTFRPQQLLLPLAVLLGESELDRIPLQRYENRRLRTGIFKTSCDFLCFFFLVKFQQYLLEIAIEQEGFMVIRADL